MYESRRYEHDQRPRRNEERFERRGDDTNWDRESERSTYGADSWNRGMDGEYRGERRMDSPSQVGERDSSRSWRGTGAGTYGGGYQAGPRENYAGRGPKGFQRSDDRIREQVCERLTDDSLLDASDIEVEVRNCEVTLKGTVRDREQKRRAEDLAESCSGVSDVTNNIRVARGDSQSQSRSAGQSQASQRTGQSGAQNQNQQNQKTNGKGSSQEHSM